MDDKEFKLRSEALAGGVEFITSCMLAAIEMVEGELGTSKDVVSSGIHMALCAQMAKVIAKQMVDRNDVDTRKKFIDHTAEVTKELVGRYFDIVDNINKEIFEHNEFSKANPAEAAEAAISRSMEEAKKKAANSSTQPLQPKPEEKKPADPPVYPEEE